MSDERTDLILNVLRTIRGKQDEHDQNFDEVITRLSSLERDFAGMKVDFVGMHAPGQHQSATRRRRAPLRFGR